jgi:1-acyl-sn-glycerol-3-phosphate acyltransferase
MIAATHISVFEPPLILSFWPTAPEAIGAIELWSRPGQSALVRLYGTIPAHRSNFDRKLIDTMISVLESGYPLLIFPERGRSHRSGLRRAARQYNADRIMLQIARLLPQAYRGVYADGMPEQSLPKES